MSPNASPTTLILPTTEGVRRDRDFFDLAEGEARDALNWLRRNRRLQTRPGLTKIGSDTIGERPLKLFQYDHDDEDGRIVCVTTVGFYHFNKTTDVWDDKTGSALTGTSSAEVVMRTMNYGGERVVLFTNGVDAPRKWDGVVASSSNIGGSPPVCGCMAVAFNRLLLGDLRSGSDISEQAVDVSEYRNPDAGYGGTVQLQFLLDSDGGIKAMESIGNRRVGIYMDDAIYIATATGGEFPFRFDLMRKGVEGPVGARACIPTPIGHIYLARDGTLRVFNGSTLEVLQRDETDDRIHAFVRDTLHWDDRGKSWLAYDPIRDELHVHYILVGSDDIEAGFILNMTDLSLWPLRWSTPIPSGMHARWISGVPYGEVVGTYAEHAVAYSDFATLSNRMLCQDDDGQLYEMIGDDDDGTAISHYIETGIRAALDQRQAAVIRYANHLIEPTSSGQEIEVQFGASQWGEDRTLETAKTVALDVAPGRGRRESFHRLRGTMFALRLSGDATTQIEWRGSQVSADPVGF